MGTFINNGRETARAESATKVEDCGPQRRDKVEDLKGINTDTNLISVGSSRRFDRAGMLKVTVGGPAAGSDTQIMIEQERQEGVQVFHLGLGHPSQRGGMKIHESRENSEPSQPISGELQ
ncbi:hypothetical protein ACFX13_009418 [Malus domestica]